MITIYTTINCRHCVKAKNTLKELGIPFDEIFADNKETLDYLQTRTDQLELPVIFYEDKVVILDEAIKKYEETNH